jgi:dienelactone hydrolase
MLPLFALLFAAPLFAQSFAAGHANLVLANPTGQGSANIPATVYYPAATAGLGVPLLPRPGGHRVLVFLHGLNVLGSGYGALGTRFAQHGYVVVLGNTAQSSASLQVQDGIATFAALAQANSQPGLLQGALDMTRVGLAGHSMGGATTRCWRHLPRLADVRAAALPEPDGGAAAALVPPDEHGLHARQRGGLRAGDTGRPRCVRRHQQRGARLLRLLPRR